jgi:hypothetical protein
MLIKRLSPLDLPEGEEVKYMLTADIEQMAKLVGIHPDRLRDVVYWSSENNGAQYFGSARPMAFFLDYNEGERAGRPRRLGLGTADIRLTGLTRMDATKSLITIPIAVMNPKFVGDLESGDVKYEVIPHIQVDTPHAKDHRFYVFPNMMSPYLNWVSSEYVVGEPDMHLNLMGYDLVLLPAKDTSFMPDISEEDRAEEAATFLQGIYDLSGRVVYDYGFNVTGEYVYMADSKDGLRIDHHVCYRGRQVYRRERSDILSPAELLKGAIQHLNLNAAEQDESEAYEIMRAIRDSSGFDGLGFRHN